MSRSRPGNDPADSVYDNFSGCALSSTPPQYIVSILH